MVEATRPPNESERLAALRAYEVLDTPPEAAFDDLTRVAARICGTPIALVSLIDAERQWFKSRVGLAASETPRSVAFCAHAILEPDDLFVVEDARKDPRFSDNPLVTGDPHVIFYAGAPLVTPSGHPLGTLCVIDDTPRRLDEETLDTLRSLARATVTQLELRRTAGELLRTNEELTRRNAEIGRFYQTLSHELKTPLTIVREYVSMVRDGLAGEICEVPREFLGTALESCDRMTMHVNDLLDMTRIETGKLRLRPQRVDVGQVVGSAVTGLVPLAAGEGVTLLARTDSHLPPVMADANRIVQVVNNLVRNAIKYSSPEGRVIVETRTAPERRGVDVSVRDNGRGIPEEHLDSIFERLYQCADDDAGSTQGLGLGLHLCREIVRMHGGDISVSSTAGVETTFRFHLPTAVSSGAEARETTREEVTP